MTPKRHRGGLAALAAVAALAAAAGADAYVPDSPVPGLADPGVDELTIAANANWLVWSQNSASRPNVYNAFADPTAAGPTKRLNETGTRAWAGGIDASSNVVAYQRVRKGQSDLRLYDLDTDARTRLTFVNTGAWEWRPSISTNSIVGSGNTKWLLFNRDANFSPTQHVLLYRVGSGRPPRLISRTARASFFVAAGQVNDDWIVYERCTPVCNVLIKKVSSPNFVRQVPNPNKRYQYAPSVTPDGTVYFMRSGRTCGANAELVRWQDGVGFMPLVDFNTPTYRRDTGETFVFRQGMDNTVYYGRVGCRTGAVDGYSVTDTP